MDFSMSSDEVSGEPEDQNEDTGELPIIQQSQSTRPTKSTITAMMAKWSQKDQKQERKGKLLHNRWPVGKGLIITEDDELIKTDAEDHKPLSKQRPKRNHNQARNQRAKEAREKALTEQQLKLQGAQQPEAPSKPEEEAKISDHQKPSKDSSEQPTKKKRNAWRRHM